MLLSTLFSNTLSLWSSHIVRDQVTHPYRTRGKIKCRVSWLLRLKNCYTKGTWETWTICVSRDFTKFRVRTNRSKERGHTAGSGWKDDNSKWRCVSGLSCVSATYQCLFEIVWTVSLYKCTYFLLPSIDFLIACCFVYETNPSRAAKPSLRFLSQSSLKIGFAARYVMTNGRISVNYEVERKWQRLQHDVRCDVTATWRHSRF